MAQRPVLWFLGVAGIAGLAAFHAAGSLDRMTSAAPAPASAASSPAVPATAERVLTVNADYRGHYLVHPSIDNYRVRMMVDTGASLIVLTDGDARALGIRPDRSAYSVALGTANGVVRGGQGDAARSPARRHLGPRCRGRGDAGRRALDQPARHLLPAPTAQLSGRGAAAWSCAAERRVSVPNPMPIRYAALAFPLHHAQAAFM
jgi:hypothetical protein